ncbi:MAG: hypothetical protein QXP36_04165 [Conexivisphaerales archaeon]|uniref:hypothetical protein n=1 Tax=Saccharolobus sp. TaxID=2100761 RepID=UPI00317E75D5
MMEKRICGVYRHVDGTLYIEFTEEGVDDWEGNKTFYASDEFIEALMKEIQKVINTLKEELKDEDVDDVDEIEDAIDYFKTLLRQVKKGRELTKAYIEDLYELGREDELEEAESRETKGSGQQ